MYSSNPIGFSSSLLGDSAFTGVIRVALLPANHSAAEAVLDYHSPVYPISGKFSVGHYEASFNWETQNWNSARQKDDLLMISLPGTVFPLHFVHIRICVSNAVILSSLTVHRGSSKFIPSGSIVGSTCKGSSSTKPAPSGYVVQTLPGTGIGVSGATWLMQVSQKLPGWHSTKGVKDASALSALRSAVMQVRLLFYPVLKKSRKEN